MQDLQQQRLAGASSIWSLPAGHKSNRNGFDGVCAARKCGANPAGEAPPRPSAKTPNPDPQAARTCERVAMPWVRGRRAVRSGGVWPIVRGRCRRGGSRGIARSTRTAARALAARSRAASSASAFDCSLREAHEVRSEHATTL